MKALGVFTIDIDGAGIAMICIFYSNTPIIVVRKAEYVTDKDKIA